MHRNVDQRLGPNSPPTPLPHEPASATGGRPGVIDWLAVLALLVLVQALFYPLYAQMVTGTKRAVSKSDFPAHHAYLAEMRARRQLLLPHPLYHLSLLGVTRVEEWITHDRSRPHGQAAIDGALAGKTPPELLAVNAKYARPAVITAVLYQAVYAVILWWWVRSGVGPVARPTAAGALAGVGLAVALMLVGPVAMLSAEDHRLYFGYIAANVWHSPTAVVARPLVLLTFAAGIALLRDHAVERRGRRAARVARAALVVIVGGLAKPSYLICFVPALGLVAAWRWVRRRPVSWGAYLLGIALPAVLLLGWQYRVNYTAGHVAGSIRWAPGEPMAGLSRWLAAKFLLSIVFPVACYALWFPEARRSAELNVCWLAFAIACVFAYCILETKQPLAANYSWSAQFALLALFVASTRFVIERVRDAATTASSCRSAALRTAVCATAFGLHLAFGVQYYVHLLMTPSTTHGYYW